MRTVHYLLATVFGAGYSPIAPGTAGSLLAVLTAYWLFPGQTPVLIPATVLITLLGVVVSGKVEQDQGGEDPSIVVIDEAAGMWLSLWFLPPEPWVYGLAFLLFRLFDIVKPYPANRVESIPGGWGIMLDDLVAGGYTLLVMHLLRWIIAG